MANVFASSTAYHGFESWSGQNHDYKICMCCFSAKHASLRRKNKELLARNQDNVSEYGDRYIRWLLFQWANTIKYKLSMLVYYKADLIIISLKINVFSSWCKIHLTYIFIFILCSNTVEDIAWRNANCIGLHIYTVCVRHIFFRLKVYPVERI